MTISENQFTSFTFQHPDTSPLHIEELETEVRGLKQQLADSQHTAAHIKMINDALVLEIRDRHRNIERLCRFLPRTQVDAAKAHNWDVHQGERQMQLLAGIEIDDNGELMKTRIHGESDGFRDCPVSGVAEVGEYTVLSRLVSDARNLDLV